MRLLRRALLLLGLLAGLIALHGLAPASGTDALIAGPHQHPAAPLVPAGPARSLDGATTSHRTVPDGAMPAQAMPASSGTPAPDHGGHGSHLDGLCLAVLTGGITFLLALAVIGRRGPGATAGASVRRPRHTRALTSALRPPDLVRLCLLRI